MLFTKIVNSPWGVFYAKIYLVSPKFHFFFTLNFVNNFNRFYSFFHSTDTWNESQYPQTENMASLFFSDIGSQDRERESRKF